MTATHMMQPSTVIIRIHSSRSRTWQRPREAEHHSISRQGVGLSARYEPIPHVSSHGALHREHMLVPLLLNRVPVRPHGARWM